MGWRKRITIDDIARMAGVTKGTVSLVINNRRGVGAATRERILKIMEAHDYRPSRAAQEVATKITRNIGAIEVAGELRGDRVSLHHEILMGIESATRARGYGLLFATHGADERSCPPMVRDRWVDGLILIGGSVDADRVAPFLECGLPLVVAGNYFPGARANCVCEDVAGGAFQAVDHLARLGHKNIGFVDGGEPHQIGEDKLRGYISALEENGLPRDERAIKRIEGAGAEEGYRGTVELLEKNPGITAILAGSSNIAVGAMRAIEEMGMRIPEDVAIAAYRDSEVAELADPPLTAVRIPGREIGEIAVKRLFESMRNRMGGISGYIVPTELIVRSSC
ncbi:MAG: LacI family DNA-binding transcriptional regulator [bacterium]